MKKILLSVFTALTLTAYGQSKSVQSHFNKLTEVTGTEFIIASMEVWEKTPDTKNTYLLFINTSTGETHQVSFPDGAAIRKLEHIKIDYDNADVTLKQPCNPDKC